MRTLGYHRIGNLVILVHGDTPPAADEWDTYIAFLGQQPAPKTRILVYSRGGSPDAVQRKKIVQVGQAHYGGILPTAVMTDSPLARGAVTAITWLVTKNKMAAFPLTKLEEALAFLEIPSTMLAEVRATISRLESEMNVPSKPRFS